MNKFMNSDNWKVWNTGGNCFVSFKKVMVKGYGQRVVGVDGEAVVIYKAKTMDDLNKEEMWEPEWVESYNRVQNLKSFLEEYFLPEAGQDILREANRHYYGFWENRSSFC